MLKHMSLWGRIPHSNQQRPCIKLSPCLNSAEIPLTQDDGPRGEMSEGAGIGFFSCLFTLPHLAPITLFSLPPPQVLSCFLQEQNQAVLRQCRPPLKSWHMATSFLRVSPHRGIFPGKGSSLLKRSSSAGSYDFSALLHNKMEHPQECLMHNGC